MLSADPRVQMPKSEIPEPNLVQDLKESMEPSDMKSREDNEEPILDIP